MLPQLRAHADMIDPIGFEHFLRETAAGLEFDVMLEAKAKDLALLRLREQLARARAGARGGGRRPALTRSCYRRAPRDGESCTRPS